MTAFLQRMLPLVLVVLMLPAIGRGQQPFPEEVYQDFRGKPLLPEFRLYGPDLDAATKFEATGLRVTLPKTRKVHQAVQVVAHFAIVKDFEITGSYEIFAADSPTNGYGVGVALIAATTNDLKTFLKMSRVMRPEQGSVFMAEYWTKGADDWRGPQELTDVRSGQLRLVRQGSHAKCQVSEGEGKPFRTIFEKDDFSTDDIRVLRFEVTDGNKPGYAVDARLIDLRIRHGGANADAAKADVVGANAPAPPKKAQDAQDRPAGTRSWLAVAVITGLMFIMLLACGAGLLLYMKHQQAKS